MDHLAPGRFRRSALVMLIAAASAPSPAKAERFAFDERRTEVRFAYTMAYTIQRGRFTRVSGTLDFDDKAPEKSMINASIATASLSTGQPIVDDTLKGASFFNAKSAPVITFNSRAVKLDSKDTANVRGEITVNGITKPITLAVSVKPHDDPALKYDVGSRAVHAIPNGLSATAGAV